LAYISAAESISVSSITFT